MICELKRVFFAIGMSSIIFSFGACELADESETNSTQMNSENAQEVEVPQSKLNETKQTNTSTPSPQILGKEALEKYKMMDSDSDAAKAIDNTQEKSPKQELKQTAKGKTEQKAKSPKKNIEVSDSAPTSIQINQAVENQQVNSNQVVENQQISESYAPATNSTSQPSLDTNHSSVSVESTQSVNQNYSQASVASNSNPTVNDSGDTVRVSSDVSYSQDDPGDTGNSDSENDSSNEVTEDIIASFE